MEFTTAFTATSLVAPVADSVTFAGPLTPSATVIVPVELTTISPLAPVTSTPARVPLTLPIVIAPVFAMKMPPVAVLASRLVTAVLILSAVPMPDKAVRATLLAEILAASPARLSVMAPPDAVMLTVPLEARTSAIAALPVPPTVISIAVAEPFVVRTMPAV